MICQGRNSSPVISSGGIVSGSRMSVRTEPFDQDLGAASLLAQPAPEHEGEADHAVIAMNARAPYEIPFRQIAAMAASAFKEQDVIILHVLDPEPVKRRRHDEVAPVLFLF